MRSDRVAKRTRGLPNIAHVKGRLDIPAGGVLVEIARRAIRIREIGKYPLPEIIARIVDLGIYIDQTGAPADIHRHCIEDAIAFEYRFDRGEEFGIRGSQSRDRKSTCLNYRQLDSQYAV